MGLQDYVAKVFSRPGSSHIRLALSLLFISLTTTVVMAIFSVLKHIFNPDLTLWESHVYTIIFTGIAVPIIALFVLLRFEKLYGKITEENLERKRAEDAFDKNLAVLAKSQEIGRLASWSYDCDSEKFEVSDEMYHLYGFNTGEVEPTKGLLYKLIHPDDQERYRGYFESLVLEGRLGGIDYRVMWPDGSVHYLHAITDSNVRGPDGRVKTMSGITQDITERKQAEDTLRQNEKFLNNIFNCIQDGVSVISKDMDMIRFNPTIEKWHGMDLMGKKCYRLFHGRDEPCENCPSIRAMREMTVQREIVRDLKGWKEIYAYPLVNDDGEVYGTVEQVRDITERKRADEELKEAKARSELYLDLMSHDINNMHQIALGYLEMAQNLPPGTQKDEMTEKPIEVLHRSARLINNVRKLQKMQDGILPTCTVEVCTMLADVQREFGSVSGKTITLKTDGCHDCYVSANELLHDVFANLVTNAIKHTGDQANIVITAGKVTENGRYFNRVTIEDDGPGIPDNLKGRIFNRMLKGTDKAKGMGLGLYLVKSLVDSYNGRVWVEDRISGDNTKGARFVVMLPAAGK